MTWRKGHGNGVGVPRIEVLPPDELPDPVPAPVAEVVGPINRDTSGRILDSAAARALGQKGGLAKAKKRQALKGLNLSKLAEDDAFHPYWKLGEEWIFERLTDLAAQAGGYVGPCPTSMIVLAGRSYVQSLFYADLADKIGGIAGVDLHMKANNLGEKSRIQNMAAYEMAVREAKARADVTENPFAALSEIEEEPPEGSAV